MTSEAEPVRESRSSLGPLPTSESASGPSTSGEHAIFEASWLELREPVDRRSRAPELVHRLRDWWEVRARSHASPSQPGAPAPGRVVDLGSGTGSNLRFLAPRLPGPQRWTLVDHDAELLERADPPGDDVDLRRFRRDLGAGPADTVRGADLVTASAFLDLASRKWIGALVTACAEAGAAAYFALTYDGTVRWWSDGDRAGSLTGSDPGDAEIREIVNAHQRRDKGLDGIALGPGAASAAANLFRESGFRTWIRPSPWILGPEDSSLALRLLDGWEAAAREERPERAEGIRRWAEAHRRAVAEGAFRLTVGHLDLLAIPRAPERRG